MGTIKDRNGMDLTEAANIKKSTSGEGMDLFLFVYVFSPSFTEIWLTNNIYGVQCDVLIYVYIHCEMIISSV